MNSQKKSNKGKIFNLKLSNIVRIILGIIYLMGAMINLRFALLTPGIYQTFADFAVIALYKTLWSSIVMPNITIWLLLVVVFEIIVGIFVLNKGSFVKIGLMGGIVFNLMLIPFWWSGWALINLLLALVQIILLIQEKFIET